MKEQLKEAKAFGTDLGLGVAGVIVGHGVPTLLKKDTPLVNGGVLLASVATAAFVKNKYVRAGALGAALISSIKLLKTGVETAMPLNGPEDLMGIKEYLHKMLPTLSGTEDASYTIAGDNDVMGLTLAEAAQQPVGDYRQISGTEALPMYGQMLSSNLQGVEMYQ